LSDSTVLSALTFPRVALLQWEKEYRMRRYFYYRGSWLYSCLLYYRGEAAWCREKTRECLKAAAAVVADTKAAMRKVVAIS